MNIRQIAKRTDTETGETQFYINIETKKNDYQIGILESQYIALILIAGTDTETGFEKIKIQECNYELTIIKDR